MIVLQELSKQDANTEGSTHKAHITSALEVCIISLQVMAESKYS